MIYRNLDTNIFNYLYHEINEVVFIYKRFDIKLFTTFPIKFAIEKK